MLQADFFWIVVGAGAVAISTAPHHARLPNGMQLTDSLRVSPGCRRPAPNVLGVGRRVEQFPFGQHALRRDGAQSCNVRSHGDGAVVLKDRRENGAWGRCVAAWDFRPYHNSRRRRRMSRSNVGDSNALSAGKGCRVWLWVGLALWGLLLMGNPRETVAAGQADGAQMGSLLYGHPHEQSPISDSRCTQVKGCGRGWQSVQAEIDAKLRDPAAFQRQNWSHPEKVQQQLPAPRTSA